MQKWQQKHRQKIHQSRIENVKSTFHKGSKSRQKNLASSRSKQIPNNNNKQSVPFIKILEIFQLQKYANLLQFYGYPEKLTKISMLDNIDQMILKVQKNDQQRFISLLNTLCLMSKNIKNKQVKQTRETKRTSLLSRSQKSHIPPTSSKGSSTVQKIQKNLQKQTSKFRIRNQIHPFSHQSVQRKVTTKKKSIPIKNILNKQRINSTMMDDLCINHTYNPKTKKIIPILTQNSNKIIKKLYDKLRNKQFDNKIQHNGNQDIDLQYKKIKDMYLSYDSATLSSNICNIDIQEIIDCFAIQIYQLINKNKIFDRSVLGKQKQDKIKQLLKESFVMVKQISKDSKTQKQQNQLIKITQKQQCRSQNSSQVVSIQQQSLQSSQSDNFSNNNVYFDSFAADFTCFDCRFKQSIFVHDPTKDDIKNFIQLVMMAGKMQKEIPIIANVYLKKLVKFAKGGRLTHRNWRNITLIVLIQASKIWDDQSLENHSFAKALHPYTTLQINRLQKYLLGFLDYTLTTDQKQYSQSYFQLRKHTSQAAKTANLVKLDLRTIKKLQEGAKKSQGKLKDFYSKCLNKSF